MTAKEHPHDIPFEIPFHLRFIGIIGASFGFTSAVDMLLVKIIQVPSPRIRYISVLVLGYCALLLGSELWRRYRRPGETVDLPKVWRWVAKGATAVGLMSIFFVLYDQTAMIGEIQLQSAILFGLTYLMKWRIRGNGKTPPKSGGGLLLRTFPAFLLYFLATFIIASAITTLFPLSLTLDKIFKIHYPREWLR